VKCNHAFCFSHVEYCDMHFVYGFCDGNACAAVQEYERRFPIEGFRLDVYLREFTRHCVILVLFRLFFCSLKGIWYERLTQERTFFRWFREVRVWPLASAYRVCRCGELYVRKNSILTMIKGSTSGTRRLCSTYGFLPLGNSTSGTIKRNFIH